jgi:hypothetical protein
MELEIDCLNLRRPSEDYYTPRTSMCIIYDPTIIFSPKKTSKKVDFTNI